LFFYSLYYVQKLQKPQPFVPSPGAPPPVNPSTPPREVAPPDVGDASQQNKQTPNQKGRKQACGRSELPSTRSNL